MSMGIPWTITKMDNEKESNDVEQEAEAMVEPSRFCHFLRG